MSQQQKTTAVPAARAPARRRGAAGFTLIEMSIVLVIIGLIVGGVLVGRDLIRTAGLKSVVTDVNKYVTAVNTFRTKYNNELPGDMSDATTFWGVAGGNAGDNYTNSCIGNGSASSPATCNGNNDGQIAFGSDGNGEQSLAWQHLANAGLVAGAYTGHGAANPNPIYIPGMNIPQSNAFPTSGFSLFYYGSINSGGAAFYTSGINHVLLFGSPPSFRALNWEDEAAYPVLSTQDAYNIDAKIDDGKPGTGNVFSLPLGSQFGTGNSSVCTTGIASAPLTATYDFTKGGPQCALFFVTGF